MNLDEVSPAYVGEERIALQVDPSTDALVGRVVQVDLDYSGCDPEGPSLPLQLTIRPPDSKKAGAVTKTFRDRVPSQISFVPQQAGTHLVMVKELAHNRWIGRLSLEIAGDLVGR